MSISLLYPHETNVPDIPDMISELVPYEFNDKVSIAEALNSLISHITNDQILILLPDCHLDYMTINNLLITNINQEVGAICSTERSLSLSPQISVKYMTTLLSPGVILLPKTTFQIVGGFDCSFKNPRCVLADFSLRLRQANLNILQSLSSFHDRLKPIPNVLLEDQEAFESKWGFSTVSFDNDAPFINMLIENSTTGSPNILDIDCGIDTLLIPLHDILPTATLTGLSHHPETNKHLPDFINIKSEKFDDPTNYFMDEFFDAILVRNKYINDLSRLSKFIPWLKPGGLLIFELENISNIKIVRDYLNPHPITLFQGQKKYTEKYWRDWIATTCLKERQVIALPAFMTDEEKVLIEQICMLISPIEYLRYNTYSWIICVEKSELA